MSLETAIKTLSRDLAALQEAVSALQVTVTEDKPVRGGSMLVDQFDNLVADLCGAVEEAGAHLAALRPAQSAGPLDQERRTLRRVHDLVHQVLFLHLEELAAHDALARLLQMGRERGREWREWSLAVQTSIEQCAAPLKKTAHAMLECWTELAGQLGRHSLSIQATNIGQQITVREDEFELGQNAA